MRPVVILVLFLTVSCGDNNRKDRLFKTLYHRTIVPKEGVIIEFIDSNFYVVKWGQESQKRVWSIESRLTGTYLIMDSDEMRLEHLSDSVITFRTGEFTPRWELKN